MDEYAAVKHKIVVSRVHSRKKEHLRKNPPGTSMNGYTKNAPIRLDEDKLDNRMKTLRDRKAIANQRKRKTQKIKKQPLPVEQVEEFLGMKPVDPSQKRAWGLDEANFLRFQRTSRHSANNVKRPPVPLKQIRLEEENENENLYRKFLKNIPNRAPPRFIGRYETVTDSTQPAQAPKQRPAPVRMGSRKSGPRSQSRYEKPPEPKPNPKTKTH
jgi:hypothetical protein